MVAVYREALIIDNYKFPAIRAVHRLAADFVGIEKECDGRLL
jgi:hypothetical protein